ncbi:glycosyltransferase [Sphingomonas sp.]|uniref:glycosyltransferase n=1 Tax=Sphingomonas sp. TaxID=28214 RepID=UPI0035C797F2
MSWAGKMRRRLPARLRKAIGGGAGVRGGEFQLLGDRARDRGEWVEAGVHYRAFLDLNPEAFPIWVQLGHVSKEAGNPTGAEQAYLRALDLRPSDADLLLNLGHLMKAIGRPDAAADFYFRSAATDTTGNAERELLAIGGQGAVHGEGPIDAAPLALPTGPEPFLKGIIDLPPDASGVLAVSLIEDGAEVARTMPRGTGRRRSFAFRLPDRICDGRPHAFEVMAGDQVIARAAVITPAWVTPGSVLQDHAGRALRAKLSPVADWRYAALAEQAGRGEAADWRTIEAAHAFLVEGARHAGLDRVYPALRFPDVASPDVSVVIPVHNKVDFTYRCLASLALMPNDASMEVIVVDDGSSDPTLDLTAIVQGVRIVRHETARGFVEACNAGAAVARGRYVVLLNNDTEVSPHWLDRLREPFDLYDDVGLVGAKLIYGDGRLQEAGGLVWRDGRAANHGRLGSTRDPRYNFLRDTDYCSGACLMLPRTLWQELDGFDRAFVPAYFEDTDLAFRVRARGLRVIYQPLAEILHYEGVSNGTDIAAQGIKRFQAINQPKFLERWASAIRSHGDSGVGRAIDVERSYPRRVLVIDTEVPQPDRSAGHHAAVQELRLLQSLGYRPTFLPLNLAYLGRYNDLLAAMGVEAIHAPFWLSAAEYLAQHVASFDLVYITRYSVAAEVMADIRRHHPGVPVVFNNADLHFLRAMRDAMDAPGEGKREEAEAVREAELAVMRSVDLTLSYNPVEHAVIQSHAQEVKVALCPWVVEPRAAGPDHAAREGVAFLGGYRHPPNRRAVEFFVREVMPLLRVSRPGIRFHIYGSAIPPEFATLAAEDVVLEGYIETVDRALDRARVFVAPLRSGAGIKGKVIEALASGVPSVLSPIAAEGTGVRDGLEALIAETPRQWADAIAALYDDPERWTRMHDAARTFVEATYSFERGRETLRRAFTDHGITTLAGPTCRRLPPIVTR